MWSVDDIYLFLFTFAAKIVFFKFMMCGFFFFCKEKGLRALQLFPLVCTWPLFHEKTGIVLLQRAYALVILFH